MIPFDPLCRCLFSYFPIKWFYNIKFSRNKVGLHWASNFTKRNIFMYKDWNTIIYGLVICKYFDYKLLILYNCLDFLPLDDSWALQGVQSLMFVDYPYINNSLVCCCELGCLIWWTILKIQGNWIRSMSTTAYKKSNNLKKIKAYLIWEIWFI